MDTKPQPIRLVVGLVLDRGISVRIAVLLLTVYILALRWLR